MPAARTLPECVDDALDNAIAEAYDEDPIVLWWDDGGYLEDLVRQASTKHGCRFHIAERSPLELRADAPRDRTVWYVPESQDEDVDWFKDVEHTGTVVEDHIGKLAVRCFEDDRLQAASLRTTYEDAPEEEREQMAQTFYQELSGEGGLPSLSKLQTKIVLDGYEDPVQFVLEHGAESLPEEDLEQIRDLLVDEGVEAVRGETDPETIVARTRRWAVAEWLVDVGLDRDHLPAEYQPETDSGIGFSRPNLQSVLSKTDRSEELAEEYLGSTQGYWHDVLRSLDDPWELADCPVDQTLEHQLWERWRSDFNDGSYETCIQRARQRHDRLETTYGAVPWTRVWKQAIDVAELAAQLDAWEDRGDTDDVVELYGDLEDGTWQIDRAVFDLSISGEPETELPPEHPATATLDKMRQSLLETRYLEYMSDLADIVVDQIDSGAPFVDEKHAHQFFAEESEHLESGQSVALFIIDALRFDLAHQLAERIRRELPGLEVTEDTWIGTLPSETSFGKAALTPGSKFSFSIDLDDGDLVPKRNGEKITNYRRKQLLKNDGWSYIMENVEEDEDHDGEAGWSKTRVAYYWNDIDKTGEGELTNLESLTENHLDTIAEIICEKLDHGEWDRAYVLSDHGFVSLPTHVDIDDVFPPDGHEAVTRRWVAGERLDDTSGVLLDESTQLGYIAEDTKIGILADPIQRFRNQGISNATFYHGGALPQEFVLNFVTITQE